MNCPYYNYFDTQSKWFDCQNTNLLLIVDILARINRPLFIFCIILGNPLIYLKQTYLTIRPASDPHLF